MKGCRKADERSSSSNNGITEDASLSMICRLQGGSQPFFSTTRGGCWINKFSCFRCALMRNESCLEDLVQGRQRENDSSKEEEGLKATLEKHASRPTLAHTMFPQLAHRRMCPILYFHPLTLETGVRGGCCEKSSRWSTPRLKHKRFMRQNMRCLSSKKSWTVRLGIWRN